MTKEVMVTMGNSTENLLRIVHREKMLLKIAINTTIGLGFLATFLIYAPIAWLGAMSISEIPLSGLPSPITFVWYKKLFADTRWLSPLGLSAALGTVVAVLCMVTTTIAGRALPRMKVNRGALLAIFLIPLIVPGVVLGVDVFVFFRSLLGFKTGLWSLVLVHFIWSFPFALLGMLVVSARFDSRLLESASDLGASNWRKFWDIEFPLLLPGVITAGFFGFLLSFNELTRSIFVRGGETTLPLFSWTEAASHSSRVPLIYALSTLITIASIVLCVLSMQLLFKEED